MKLKFLTINIWFGGKIWDNLIGYIKEQEADILCIQEVYDGHDPNLEKRFRTMDEFKSELNNLSYSAFGATVFDTGKNIYWGNAIFSKFPIKSSRTIFFDLPLTHYDFQTDHDPRLAAEGVLEGEIEIPGRDTYVYSWHGVWDHHGGDTEKRHIMEKQIIENLSGHESVILAGDTNMNPESKIIQNIEMTLGLESVFGTSLKSTFNMSQKDNPGNYANSPVDMVFISKNFKVIKKEMPQVNISDHYPLIVELEY